MQIINSRTVAIPLAVAASFIMMSTNALAKTDNNVKPGWGFGDTNHIHIGPPGQSVQPFSTVTQVNNSTSSITLGVSTNTGGNTANNNKGVVAIVTGATTTIIKFVNSVGHNIFGA
jgi:hypothetical protein